MIIDNEDSESLITNKKNKQQAGNSVNVSKNHDMENEGRKEVNNDIDEMESILQIRKLLLVK